MTELDARVTRLEIEMAEIRETAEQAAARDTAHIPAVLQGHTRVLNALRKTQREHSERLDRLEQKVESLDRKFDEGFTKLNLGQGQIIALLNVAIGRPDDET